MKTPKLTVAEWQTRLEETFLSPAKELAAVRHEEGAAAAELHATLRGHWALMDSFHEFFVRTLRQALTPAKGNAPRSEQWWIMLLEFLTAFRTWRAAEVVFRSGYPPSGYALLRDLKDRALVLSAVATGLTTFRDVHGYAAMEADEGEVGKEMKKLRKKEEFRIRKHLIGSASDLSPTTVAELRGWEGLFHTEVHGARLSQTEFLPWLKGEEPLTFGPRLREVTGATYTNRASEVGWMWVRLLPLLQTGGGFDSTWRSDWAVLEESFSYMVLTLKELGKPGVDALVDALAELLASKFAFDADTRFGEM